MRWAINSVYVVLFVLLMLILLLLEGLHAWHQMEQAQYDKLHRYGQLGIQGVVSNLRLTELAAQQAASAATAAIELGYATREGICEILHQSMLNMPWLFAASTTMEQNSIDTLDTYAIQHRGLQPTVHFDAGWYLGAENKPEPLENSLSDGKAYRYYYEETTFWEREYYKKLKAGSNIFISDIYTEQHSTKGPVPMMSVVVPVRAKGQFYGVMVFDIEVDALVGQINALNASIDGDIAVVTLAGDIIMTADAQLMDKPAELLGDLSAEHLAQASSQEAVEYIAETATGKCLRRMEKFDLLDSGRQWILIAQLPMKTLYAELRRLIWGSLLAMLIGVTLFTVASAYGIKRFSRQFGQLQRFVASMAQGQLATASNVAPLLVKSHRSIAT